MAHRQVVLTLPRQPRIYFGLDRKLLGEPPIRAWRTPRLCLAAWFDSDEVTPGAVGFAQTTRESLGWHPHLLGLQTDGGRLPDGIFRHLLGVRFDASLDAERRAQPARCRLDWVLSSWRCVASRCSSRT